MQFCLDWTNTLELPACLLKILQNQEKIFLNEFKKLQTVEIKKRKENTKEVLSGILI